MQNYKFLIRDDMKTICVFAGAANGMSPQFSKEAFRIGQMIGAEGHKLVYGGGRTGLMGAFADGALSSGAHITGIIPEFLQSHEIGHTGVAELIITGSMHDRKSLMYKNTTDFILLPGGLGSLDETMEVLTWCQLKLLSAKFHIFDFNGFWQPMQKLLTHITEHGFMHSTNLDYVSWAKTANELLDNLHGK